MDSNTADFSGMTANGGQIKVNYTLASGPAIPIFGNSFPMVFTVSDITAAKGDASNDFKWRNPTTNGAYNAHNVGLLFDVPTIMSGLPSANERSYSADGFGYMSLLNDGSMLEVASFTVKTSNAPVAAGYALVGQDINYASIGNTVGNGSINTQGLFPYFVDLTNTYGATSTLGILAFDAPSSSNKISNGTDFPAWDMNGTMTFAPVPEPSGAALACVAGALALGLRRRPQSAKG